MSTSLETLRERERERGLWTKSLEHLSVIDFLNLMIYARRL